MTAEPTHERPAPPSPRRSIPGLAALVLVFAGGACVSPRRGTAPRPPSSMQRSVVGAAWDDPQRCVTAVNAGARFSRAHFRARVVTWALDAFPDGPAGDGTSLEWLACALTWLDADVVALQRLRLDGAAGDALREVVRRLNDGTHAGWQWQSDLCPGAGRLHVVFLWRSDRVNVTLVATHPEADTSPHLDIAHPDCPGTLTPALAAHVEMRAGGLDFHLLTTELAPGDAVEALRRRSDAWRALATVARARQALRPDPDVLVAAAFNAVGAVGTNPTSAIRERQALATTLATLSPAFGLYEPADGCTEYAGATARQTDFFVASAGMEEVKGLTPRVAGVCGAMRCREIDPSAYAALRQLSRHCPVVFDLNDRDVDG
ncbi:MAG: hypothetical protein HY903_23720 [Deltaproteobacteria bacterium]|nr:hypothetical protein [Deltaproteobacteria bacterium]